MDKTILHGTRFKLTWAINAVQLRNLPTKEWIRSLNFDTTALSNEAFRRLGEYDIIIVVILVIEE
jgi:hypothetical protein